MIMNVHGCKNFIKSRSFVSKEIEENYLDRPGLISSYKKYLSYIKSRFFLKNHKHWLLYYSLSWQDEFFKKSRDTTKEAFKLSKTTYERNCIYNTLGNKKKFLAIIGLDDASLLSAIQKTTKLGSIIICSKRLDIYSKKNLQKIYDIALKNTNSDTFEMNSFIDITNLLVYIKNFSEFLVRGFGSFDDIKSSVEVLFHDVLSNQMGGK